MREDERDRYKSEFYKEFFEQNRQLLHDNPIEYHHQARIYVTRKLEGMLDEKKKTY
ncbi:MAG: hypothetical protein KKF56_05075 [Nanoarchaeota archaeon]|nr:hypothetical protein [Nanoarchaeota archaeon]